MKFRVSAKFDRHDVWIGVYWSSLSNQWQTGILMFVCILPMLPIKLMLWWDRGN